jgi:flagellar biosynthesis protein
VPDRRQRVVALQYDASSRSAAPRVVAKGMGDLAERILDVARRNNIPLYEDPELIEILSHLDVGSQIKPELYHAVAEVLIFIYKMNRKKRAVVVDQIKKQQSGGRGTNV